MQLRFSDQFAERKAAIIELFQRVFAASEGEAEGQAIGALVTGLLDLPKPVLHVFNAYAGDELVGAVIFSRLWFEEDDARVFLLSPAAVRTDMQGGGVGQALLQHGLAELARHGVDVAITYGDPAYYSKVGFVQITPEEVYSPLPMSMPHGWLGQRLDGGGALTLRGASQCVEPLNNPDYW